MTNEPRFWAVIIIGPPGAGKDTQADLLSTELGLIQVKTSSIIDEKFKNASTDDTVLQEQIKRKRAGTLVEPALVQAWVIEKIREVAGNHDGIVFSGSPRTPDEAETELPVLKEFYANNIKIIDIQVSLEESVKRNQFRRICQANNHPIPNLPEYEGITACPKDGSPIITREDDKPEIITSRYQVYLKETAPVLDFLKEKGYTIITINGEQPIEDVHRDILNRLW